MALNMEDVLTVLSKNKEGLKILDSPTRIESEVEDSAEECQTTPQDILDSLSKYTVRKNGAYSKDTCGLCQSNYSIGDHVVCLPCQHNFHKYCIENWLKWVKSTCPVDKKSVIRKECLKQVESERLQMKIQKLLLKGKTALSSPKMITIKGDQSKEMSDKPIPSPSPVMNDIRKPSPSKQVDIKEKELKAIVCSPLRKHSSRNNRSNSYRSEEAVKFSHESPILRPGTSKQLPSLTSPTTHKSAKCVKKSPEKFNYRDFLKSLDSPWNTPILISSYHTTHKNSGEKGMLFGDNVNDAKQKCSRVNKQRHSEDCEVPKLFRKMVSRRCLTSAGLRYSTEKRGGWVYKNDINLPRRRSGLCRKPKTA